MFKFQVRFVFEKKKTKIKIRRDRHELRSTLVTLNIYFLNLTIFYLNFQKIRLTIDFCFNKT